MTSRKFAVTKMIAYYSVTYTGDEDCLVHDYRN